MKQYEIKEFNLRSIFKVTAYFMIIPAAIFLLISVVLAVFGLISGEHELLFIGGIYVVFSVLMIPIYGALNILISLIYNFFSKKYGGLVFSVEEADK